MKLIKDLGSLYPTEKSTKRRGFGIYECPDCNEHIKMENRSVKKSVTGLCRKCANKKSSTFHGQSRTRLYKVWHGMKQRCLNKNDTGYKYYGALGTNVFDDWLEFEPFQKWALENGYEDNLTIDRIEGSGNYEPSNCRWVNRLVQQRNTRKIRKGNTSGYRGVSETGIKTKLPWRARITVSNKQIQIGTYNTAKEAALAYDEYVLYNCLEHTMNFEY